MPLGIQLALAALVGLGLGFIFAWLYGRGRTGTPDGRLENELRQQVAQRESDLAKLRADLTDANTARAAAEASRAAAEKLVADQRAMHERTLQEAKTAQEKALADLREAFRALSADALKPATSTTRRKVSSPQRPRAWLDFNTERNCAVSAASERLECASVSICFFTSPSVPACALSDCCKRC